MRENPPRLPPGVVEDMPPDEESVLGSDLGTSAKVTWAWLKSKYGKPRAGELGYDRAYDRDYYNGKIGRLYIQVRPYDARDQWLRNLDQEFTADGLKDAQKYGFYLLQQHPEVHGFWLTGVLDIYWTKLGRSEARRAMDLGVYQRAEQTPNARGRLEPGQYLETRHVLAGRYRGKDISDRALLTHTVVVGPDGRDVRVLCGFRTEGMADMYSATDAGRSGPPTCARCLERWKKLQMQTNPRRRVAFTDGPRGTEQKLANLRRDQDVVQRQLELAHRQGNTRAIEQLLEMERDLDRRVDEVAFEPNGADSEYRGCRIEVIENPTQLGYYTGEGMRRRSGKGRNIGRQYLIHLGEAGDGGTKMVSTMRAAREYIDDYFGPEHTPNASSYYVWVLASDGTPKDEGPYGPKDLESAKTFARIAATNGSHDRAVSRGLDPKSTSFEVVRRYARGTGKSVL